MWIVDSSLSSLLATFENIRRTQAENRERLPDLEDRASRLKEVREYAIRENEALWRKARENLKDNGVRVFFVRSGVEAIEVVLSLVGDEKLVVKSKSNVTKQIHLTESLEARGVEVVETDIGDRIIQIARMPPTHPTCPAANLDRYEIAGILERHLKRPVPPDPGTITGLLRDEIREKIRCAKIGITGANAVCAGEGSLVLVHNEGNILKVATETERQIIITSREKIYPNLDEAINMVKVLTFYGTGHITTSYIDVISGPSKTADVEGILVPGIHGPRDVILIVLETPGITSEPELYHCIGCGNCLTICPTYRAVGDRFGRESQLGGIGLAKASITDPVEEVFYCTTCDLCRENCPLEIPVRETLLKIRREYVKRYNLIEGHEKLIQNIRETGRIFNEKPPEVGEVKRASIVYFRGCMSTFRRREIAEAAEDLLNKTGVEYTLIDERCCGSPVLKTGTGIEELIDHNISQIEESGAETILFTCPGCLETFRDHYPERYNLLHISEYLSEYLKREIEAGKIELKEVAEASVTYHKPCHLRTDAPEEILREIPGITYREIEKGCCGAGGGVRSAYPLLSRAIAEERLQAIKETGAQAILSACPFCKENLKEGKQPIYDITEYLKKMIE